MKIIASVVTVSYNDTIFFRRDESGEITWRNKDLQKVSEKVFKELEEKFILKS